MPYKAGETVGPQDILFSESRGLKLGGFAELGGSLDFYGNWVPARTLGNNDDPYTAAARIMSIAGHLASTRVPLEGAKRIAIEDTKEHFEKEEDPDGNPWIRLSDKHRAYKEEYQYREEILQMTGHLMDAATSSDAWVIIGEALVFDPMVLPQDKGFNYGAFHQGVTPRRKHEVGGVFEFQKGKGFVQTAEKSISGVPPRPFIGLSDQAMEQIAAEFAAWFETAVDEGTGIGVVPEMGANVMGEFPIIGYTKRGQPRLSTGQFGRRL